MTRSGRRLILDLMPGSHAICRLEAGDPVPDWAMDGGGFCSITRTSAELSIVCDESRVPRDAKAQRGWRSLALRGPIDFSESGVLASIVAPLAADRIPIFAVSTYDTDYLLVGGIDLDRSVEALRRAGHRVFLSGALERLKTCLQGSGDQAVKAHEAAELIRATGGYRWVGIYEVTGAAIAAIGWTGPNAPSVPLFPATQGLNGAAVAARAAVVVGDVRADPRYLPTFDATRSEMVVPVTARPHGAVMGTIDVESDALDAFTDEDRRLVESCAAALAPLWEPGG